MTHFPREAYAPLEPYAPDRRPVPVDLSDNTSRFGVHPGALAVIEGADPEELLRYPPVYADRLREAVARRFGIAPEQVSTGCGSDDLLDSIFRAAAGPGGGVAYIPPTFSMVEIFARMNALEPRPVEAARAAADPGVLVEEALRGGGGAVVYLCRPNNPTGEVAPRGWVEALVRAVEDAAAGEGSGSPVLVLDEAYADYSGDDFLQEAASSARVVVIRTLSKLYGLAGLRVGFAVGGAEVIRELEKSRGPYKVNRLAEGAAVAALDDAEGWVPGVLAATIEGREHLVAGLEARGYAPLPSGANFVLVPVPDAPALTAALRDRGVAVRPFPALPGIGDAIRVSVGPEHELESFFASLDETAR